jgi:hypothetical protein
MKNKSLLVLGSVVAAASAHAETATDTLVTTVSGITGQATTAYIAAAGLGVAVLLVGVVVKLSRKGWSLR